jgi:iron(III) transport system substrate-binding protein
MSMTLSRLLPRALAIALAACLTLPASAQQKVLNLYSSRHYDTDEALYKNFETKTGIKVNRIEAGEDALIERIRSEGTRSPADVLITVDVGRLYRAEQMGFFQPIRSTALLERVPGELRHPENLWFGFSVRARPIYYNKASINPQEVQNYEDLANPKFKGKVCSRSGGHVYSLSMMSAMIQNLGPQKAEEWARGVVGNFARQPKGGDTDQIRAVATGECQLAIGNTYYFVRLMKSAKPEDQDVVKKVGMIFPNQANRGAHVNVSGAGLMKNAPNRENAIKFLEYLASDDAQNYFANGNNEYPVVESLKVTNTQLASLGSFKRDSVNISILGKNQAIAQVTYDRAGWK